MGVREKAKLKIHTVDGMEEDGTKHGIIVANAGALVNVLVAGERVFVSLVMVLALLIVKPVKAKEKFSVGKLPMDKKDIDPYKNIPSIIPLTKWLQVGNEL